MLFAKAKAKAVFETNDRLLLHTHTVILCKSNLKREGTPEDLNLNTPMPLNHLAVDVENDKPEIFVSFE